MAVWIKAGAPIAAGTGYGRDGEVIVASGDADVPLTAGAMFGSVHGMKGSVIPAGASRVHLPHRAVGVIHLVPAHLTLA